MHPGEKAVAAVTLNPCVDRTLTVDRLLPGEHHVTTDVQEIVAGKGIDVNVVLRHLQVPTLALGFDFTRSGSPVSQFLAQEGIPFICHSMDQALRINTKIFDAGQRQMTEINCPGPQLCPEDAQTFLFMLRGAMDSIGLLAVCGSVPPGIPADVYRKAIDIAHAHRIPAVLDATGPLLKEALRARPEVVKPNIDEMALLLGTRPSTLEECVAACRQLTCQGIDAVCLTLGSGGALMVTQREAWFSEGLHIDVHGLQGAGDSVVAGICAAMRHTQDPAQWLRWGVAAAHGSLIRPGTLLCEKHAFEQFLSRIPIRPL